LLIPDQKIIVPDLLSFAIRRPSGCDLEHVGSRGLLLQRLAEVARAGLHLVEETNILDRNHGLIGECGGNSICFSLNGCRTGRVIANTPIWEPTPDQSTWWTLPLGGVGGTACVPPPGHGECVDTILGHGLWPAKSVPARGAKLVNGPLRNNVVIPQ
jgi:hypothetical protein